MEKLSEVLNGCKKKIRVSSAEIIVHGTKKKPYYEIKYRALSDGQIHMGYSSCNLDLVFEWLEECFEVVERNKADVSEQVKELRIEAQVHRNNGTRKRLEQAADTIESLSAKLADMERSAENCGGGWIYCGDGKNLPETRENILICQRDGYVSMGYFLQNEFLDSNNCPFEDVIAWQPKPEPYHEP